LLQGVYNPITFVEISQRVRAFGANLYQKWKFSCFGAHSTASIEAKFGMTKQAHVQLGHDKFHINGCKESPLCGENADFQPLSKRNTGRFPLGGNRIFKAKLR